MPDPDGLDLAKDHIERLKRKYFLEKMREERERRSRRWSARREYYDVNVHLYGYREDHSMFNELELFCIMSGEAL